MTPYMKMFLVVLALGLLCFVYLFSYVGRLVTAILGA